MHFRRMFTFSGNISKKMYRLTFRRESEVTYMAAYPTNNPPSYGYATAQPMVLTMLCICVHLFSNTWFLYLNELSTFAYTFEEINSSAFPVPYCNNVYICWLMSLISLQI